MVSTLLIVEVAITVFAGITLKLKFGKNLASLCLGLLIVSNLVRTPKNWASKFSRTESHLLGGTDSNALRHRSILEQSLCKRTDTSLVHVQHSLAAWSDYYLGNVLE
jgi:hypothetical protein